MDLTHVIIGPVVTEKSERLKAGVTGKSGKTTHTYTLQVHHGATKVDIGRALEKFYDIKVRKVRILWVRPKVRQLGAGGVMEKRHLSKRALVTLTESSKAL